MSPGLFKNVIYELLIYKSYIYHLYVWTGFGMK